MGFIAIPAPKVKATMETEVSAGLSPGTSTLRIRVSFYSVFNLRERLVCASGQFVPGRFRLSIYHFIFRAFSVHLRDFFSKIFPCSEAPARLPGAPPFRPRLRLWQCRSCSCRGRNGRRYVWPVCRAGWKWPRGVPAW